MKYILLLFFSALSPLFILSQDCYTFQEYEAVGKQMANIDSLYKPALSSNPENSVFGDRQEEFYNSWKEFLTELNTHLSENDFSWEKKTRCFNKIYFDESGAVDTFLFNFKPGDI